MTDTNPRPASRATIEDVAAAAGVSVATVSRALRGLPNVAAATRTRIEDTAAQLDYRPDPAASRLAAGRSRTIAVAVPVVNTWYSAQVVAGVEAVCSEAGYDMILMSVGIDASRRRRLDAKAALDRRVDGLVLVDLAITDDEIDSLLGSQLAVASIGPKLARMSTFGIDNVHVGEIATTHLLDLGHTRIGLIGEDTVPVFEFEVPGQRLSGHTRALERAGIAPDPELIAFGEFAIDGGYEAFDRLMALDDPPTAVFALADEMAFGALQRARELGLDVPGDVSIIGVDDHPVAAVVGLTTIHQDVSVQGAHAARAVLDALVGTETELINETSPVRLIERATTGPRR
jgi:LacI family repressor for deo operon, udp, cdd, tsx, nupC, and nupG